MGTRVAALVSNIGYIPSYKPRNPKLRPKLLEDDEAWKVLVEDVRQHIKTSQAKNRGKGEVKPFSILLVDLAASEDGKKSGMGKKVRYLMYCRTARFDTFHVRERNQREMTHQQKKLMLRPL